MSVITRLEERRGQILQEMKQIRAMRKGSVIKQYFKVKKNGEKEPVLKGPYWLYTRKEKGKTVGQRLRKDDAERFSEEVDACHHFQGLCREYAEVTERLGTLERELGAGSPEKKRRRSRSSRTRR